MKQYKTFLLLALIFSSADSSSGVYSEMMEKEELERLGKIQDCGAPPPSPNAFDRLINNKKMKDSEDHDRCLRTNARRMELMDGQLYAQKINNIQNSCHNAIRSMSKNPSTLSFNYDRNWKVTDGGYSITVNGSDSNGYFVVTCFMDRNYSVTNVR